LNRAILVLAVLLGLAFLPEVHAVGPWDGFTNADFSNQCQSWSLSQVNGSNTCVGANGSPSGYGTGNSVQASYTFSNSYDEQGWAQSYPGWSIPFNPDTLHSTCIDPPTCDSYQEEGYDYVVTAEYEVQSLSTGNSQNPWYHIGFDFSIGWSGNVGSCNKANLEFMIDLAASTSRSQQSCANSGQGSLWMYSGYTVAQYTGTSFYTLNVDISNQVLAVAYDLNLPTGVFTGGMIGVETSGYNIQIVIVQAALTVTYTNACYGAACHGCSPRGCPTTGT
jgi:hypothetical protein